MRELNVCRIVRPAGAQRNHVIKRRRKRMRPRLSIHPTTTQSTTTTIPFANLSDQNPLNGGRTLLPSATLLVIRSPPVIPRLVCPIRKDPPIVALAKPMTEMLAITAFNVTRTFDMGALAKRVAP